jgi:hypothetical protein
MSDHGHREAFARRLHEVCDEMGVVEGHGRYSDLARRLSLTSKAVRKWFLAMNWPTLDIAVELANMGTVNLTWLLQGVGPKRGDRIDPNALALVEALVNLPKQERAHVANYLRFEFQTLPRWFAEEQRARYDAALEAVAALPEAPPKQTSKAA